MNKVILIGNMTADAEIRTTTTGIPVATFTVAVNRNYTNASGERDVDFIKCVAFNKIAENLEKYTGKGSKVAVSGRIQNRSYQAQDGSTRWITEIICEQVEFLTRKHEQKQQEMNNQYDVPMKPEHEEDDYYKNYGLSSKDLPF